MSKPILCVGELLIDFFSSNLNVDLKDELTFIKKAGGAPANVCATIAKLGGDAYFLGKVGHDPFGQFLESTLVSVGVHTNFLLKDPSTPTTLAFVSLQEEGQRDFIFYRGADAQLSIDEIPLDQLDTIQIIHFGSATALLTSPFQQTYKELLMYAKNNNHYISFDPNFRIDLWKGQEEYFRTLVLDCIPYANFLKVSDEELTLLTKESDMKKATAYLHTLGTKCIAVTLGKEGTFFSDNGRSTLIPSIQINAIDTTGAGDAFVGALLFQLSKVEDWQAISFEEWERIIGFSNKVGAIVCENVGAIESLPTLEDVLSK